MSLAALKPDIGFDGYRNAHELTLAKLEALSEEIAAQREARRSYKYIGLALRAWKKGDIGRAGRLALKAVNEDETNARAVHLLGMVMERMGQWRKALAMYERAFALDPEDPNLILDLGISASNLKLVDGAERMFRLYIEACPDSPLGYNNLGGLLCKNGRVNEGIELLKTAIYRMPGEAVLWNSLATALAEDGRCEESLVFYQEGIRLDPGFPRAWHNLAYAYSHLGRLEEALECYNTALSKTTQQSERVETWHSRSLCLIGLGRIEEGFAEYEIRCNPTFRDCLRYVTKAPRWNGEPLAGKKLLLIAEQGLGDEIMFANVAPDLAEAVGPEGKLEIAVDKRLIPLFRRSFPLAEIGDYADRKATTKEGASHELRFIPWATGDNEPDYYIQGGSAVRFFRKTLADFPGKPFLTPDPELVARYRKMLEAIGPGPYVGICWRSMLLAGKRHKYYSPLDLWGPILKTPGVTFINVQYGDCAEELNRACERHGVKVHAIEGLDLKNDLDGLAALSAALDLVISAPTASAAMAGSVGTEVWFLTAGRAWPQLGADYYPWYRKTRVFVCSKFGDWTAPLGEIAGALSEFSHSKK